MISDEDRVAMASRLRNAAENHGEVHGVPDSEVLCILGIGTGFADGFADKADVEAFADLIDVQTTALDLTDAARTVHGEEVRGWECRECGQSCEEMYGEYEYCPHCGRKVVEP